MRGAKLKVLLFRSSIPGTYGLRAITDARNNEGI